MMFLEKLLHPLSNWFVIYPDGQHSRPMCYRVAKNYAEIFGGEIQPTDKPIYDLGLRE